MVGAAGWQGIPAEQVARVDLVPHAIFDEANQVAAIGFLAHLRRRKGYPGRQRVDLPTSAYDACVACTSVASAHFKATALAFRQFAALRPDLTRHVRVVMQDQGLNFVVKMHKSPASSAHIRVDVAQDRLDLLAALQPYQLIFRFHYYGRNGQPLTKPLAARLGNMTRTLEKRLLWRQFGRRARPSKPKLTVAVEDLRDLTQQRRVRGAKAPSLLEALVGHLHERGYKHERIAAALGVDQRAVRNALARWKGPRKGESAALPQITVESV